jgi:hypothetical protein
MNTLRNRAGIVGFSVLALLLAARAQVNVTTHHNDNARTGPSLGKCSPNR